MTTSPPNWRSSSTTRRALAGAVVVAGLIALFGARQRERDSAIRVILAFGIGLLFLFVLALTVTGAAQVVGTLLVLSLARHSPVPIVVVP